VELNSFTRIARALVLTFLIILFSCEENGKVIDCKDCTSYEPADAILKAEVVPNSSTGVWIKLWEGKLEDNILVDSVKIFNTSYEIKVALNKSYTITATYRIDNKIYTAIDSATPRVRYTTDYCEEACYYIYDHTFDLRLKYTK
jgi:hypothetical protein